MTLMQHHRKQLHASAIPDDFIEAARIESVTRWRSLLDWGFPEWQARQTGIGPESPGLLFPSFGVTGEDPKYGRVRPDNPKNPKIKYIQPSGVPNSLYVPPMRQACLKDPEQPLWIEEGEKKTLAMAALGECAIGIPGVTGWRGKGYAKGLTALADWELIALNDRRIYPTVDSDAAHNTNVIVVTERLHKFIILRHGHSFPIIVADVPGLAKTGVDDFIASRAGKCPKEIILEIAALAHSDLPDFREIKRLQELAKRDPEGPPLIETNGVSLPEMADQAIAALIKKNEPNPEIFNRGGRVVHIEIDESGRPSACELKTHGIRHYLSRSADYVSTSEKRGTVPVFPPDKVCEDVLVKTDRHSLPSLAAISTAPTFAPDGTLLDTPGYQPQTKTFYMPAPGFHLPDTTPTPENVQAAKSLLLDDLLVDFPFKQAADRAHALGVTLQPFVRPMYSGSSPMVLMNASTPGTGKTKLAVVTQIPFLGRICDARPAPCTEEEWTKTIAAAFGSGAPVVLFDNVRKLASATLELALTAPYSFTSRVLGTAEERTYPVTQTWIATGNNLQIYGDMGRRLVWIRLETDEENPEDRKGFKHDPLEPWALKHHAELAGACITLVRSWIAAGMPPYSGTRKGSYEAWCDVIGGILEHHGIPGFLANAKDTSDQFDDRPARWRAFLKQWHKQYGSDKKGVADVTELALEYFPDEIGDKDKPRAVSTRIGFLVRSHVDRVFGGYRLRAAEKLNGAARYTVVEAKGANNEPIEPYEPFTVDVMEYPVNSYSDTLRDAGEKVHKVPEVHYRDMARVQNPDIAQSIIDVLQQSGFPVRAETCIKDVRILHPSRNGDVEQTIAELQSVGWITGTKVSSGTLLYELVKGEG